MFARLNRLTHPVRMAAFAAAMMIGAVAGAQTTQPASFKFSFAANAPAGFTKVAANAAYSEETGFGFEPGAAVKEDNGFATSDAPFSFSAKVPEGSYRVTLTLGDPQAESITTVKSELRRLMLEAVQTKPAQTVTKTIMVNVRTPKIGDSGQVRLKARENQKTPGGEWAAWDDKLTLQFSDKHPAVVSVQIDPADPSIPTIYLCGDSTVCDQPAEPFNSWGQMLPRWFKPDVIVANHGESGETGPAFYGDGRMQKIMTTLKAGDWVFVQFGHNDMKSMQADRYAQQLTRFVTDTRSKGATPVLITPVSRKGFDAEGKTTNSFRDFPDAVKRVAKEQNVTLIDLQAMSAKFYDTLGRDRIQPAFANEREGTHHSDYGSYEIARCIVQGIIDNKLPLASHVVDEWKTYDPTPPMMLEEFHLPPDPRPARSETPLGS